MKRTPMQMKYEGVKTMKPKLNSQILHLRLVYASCGIFRLLWSDGLVLGTPRALVLSKTKATFRLEFQWIQVFKLIWVDSRKISWSNHALEKIKISLTF